MNDLKAPTVAAKAISEVLSSISYEGYERRIASLSVIFALLESHYGARASGGPQDAHELLLKFLEYLAPTVAGISDTAFPFSGVMREVIRCTTCRTTKASESRFVVLEIKPSDEVFGTKKELVEDYYCDFCGPTVIVKTTSILVPPAVLAVHVNQSFFSNGLMKTPSLREIDEYLGSWKLKAIVFHHGAHAQGHYYCAKRKTSSCSSIDETARFSGTSSTTKSSPGAQTVKNLKNWWITSDTLVKEASTSEVFSKSSEASILFYEKESSTK